MNASQLLDEVLGHIRLIKDDKDKLELLLEFIQDQLISDEEDELEEIPPAFEKVIKPIAQGIDSGCICYLNMDTMELEEVPVDLMENFDDDEDLQLHHPEWKNCFEINPLESQESFEIMEKFTWQLTDTVLQNELTNTLNRKKPFANFKRIVESSEQRNTWFEFKDNELQKYVRTQIYLHLTFYSGTKSDDDSDDPNTLPF